MATETIEATDHKLLVGGEWLETGEWDEVESPYDGTVVGRVAQGDAALVERAAKAAHEAFSAGDFPQHERAAVLDRAAGIVAERVDELALAIAAEAGKPLKTADGRGLALRRDARLLLGRGAQADRRHGADGRLGRRRRQARGDDAGALRRRRRDQPLQLPAQPGRPQARPGDRRRQRGRAQAGRPDPDLGAEAGRDPARGGPPRGLAERRPRTGLGGRQRDRRERADQGDHLHRLGSGRLGDPQQGPSQEGQPRAGLERAADRQRRRRLGDGGGQGQAPCLLARRAELHLDPADPRARGDRRRLHRALRRQRRVARGRRPARPGHRRRPADLARRSRPGQGVGRRGGGARGARSSPAASWSTRAAAWRRP